MPKNPKLTARRLLRTLNEAKRQPAPPLNVVKWRGELRDIRNLLIKLRDKAEDEQDRVDELLYDADQLTQAQEDKYEKLGDHMENCVDAIANAINEIDMCL